MQIKAILFDIGGVLIDLDFSRAVKRAAIACGRTPADVMARLFGAGDPMSADRMEYMNEYECGRISDEEFHLNCLRVLDAEIPFEHFTAAWNDIFLEPIHETVALAEALRASGKFTLGVLSNNNALHWKFLKPLLPVVSTFKHVYLSHEIGCKKPEAAAFQTALDGMKVRADETLFIDDLKDNIEAAEKLGMHTIHATNACVVREELEKRGLSNGL